MNDGTSRLFAFHGCDHKVGTTMLSHETAKLIASQLKNQKVLFIAMNGHDYNKYSRGNFSSIENIKIKVDNNLLSPEDIYGSCAKDDELYVLGGVKGVFTHRDYSAFFPEYLLKKALEAFDLIIADSGNDVDSGLCVGTLKMTSERFIVINQNQGCLVRFEDLSKIYQALNIDFQYCIINRYQPDDPYDISYIRNRLKKGSENMFITVRDEPEYSHLAEMDEMLISGYKCPGYTKDLKDIAYILMKRAGFSDTNDEPKKKKLFNFM